MGATSPLAGTQSGPNTPGFSAALSTLSLGAGNSTGLGNSGPLMTAETVAPCLKGANRNKAKLREVCFHSAAGLKLESEECYALLLQLHCVCVTATA